MAAGQIGALMHLEGAEAVAPDLSNLDFLYAAGVLGAAIGAFSGWKVVRYSHDNPDNPVDDFFLAASFVPGDLTTLRLGIVPAR